MGMNALCSWSFMSLHNMISLLLSEVLLSLWSDLSLLSLLHENLVSFHEAKPRKYRGPLSFHHQGLFKLAHRHSPEVHPSDYIHLFLQFMLQQKLLQRSRLKL